MPTDTAFLRIEFLILVFMSFIAPGLIYVHILRNPKHKRAHVLALGFCLVLLSGLDVILLQSLESVASQTTDLMDDLVFASEYSLALYILPLVSAALGTDLLSHVITSHLVISEHPQDKKE